MSVGRTEMGWEIGTSFRGFASVASVILDEAFSSLFRNNSIDFQSSQPRQPRRSTFRVRSELGRIRITSYHHDNLIHDEALRFCKSQAMEKS